MDGDYWGIFLIVVYKVFQLLTDYPVAGRARLHQIVLITPGILIFAAQYADYVESDHFENR